jgi:hypothetical protein
MAEQVPFGTFFLRNLLAQSDAARPGAISSLTSFKFRFSYSSYATLVLVSAVISPQRGKSIRLICLRTPNPQRKVARKKNEDQKAAVAAGTEQYALSI